MEIEMDTHTTMAIPALITKTVHLCSFCNFFFRFFFQERASLSFSSFDHNRETHTSKSYVRIVLREPRHSECFGAFWNVYPIKIN